LIEYMPEATRQVDDLLQHDEDQQRDGAARALLATLKAAERRIADQPDAGLPAPRPYPQLARPGRAWVKSGRDSVALSD
jgi:plasmid stabilization system protein ParE